MKKKTILVCSFIIILITYISAVAQTCMFICYGTEPNEAELNITTKLEEWGYIVVPLQPSVLDTFTEDDYLTYDFIFASETINSSHLAPLKLIPCPLILAEPWATKPGVLDWSIEKAVDDLPPEPVLIVDNTDHPLAAGYKENDIVELATDGKIAYSIPDIDIIPIAIMTSDHNKSSLYGVEKGTENVIGDSTQNRAVHIGIHENGYPFLTDAMFEFIHAAIKWVTETTDVEEKGNKYPAGYNLAQNYPNPFNPTTNIQFQIPKDGHVTISVYNSLGQQVATLVDENLKYGVYHVTFEAAEFASGLYFYKIQANDFLKVKKMMLLE